MQHIKIQNIQKHVEVHATRCNDSTVMECLPLLLQRVANDNCTWNHDLTRSVNAVWRSVMSLCLSAMSLSIIVPQCPACPAVAVPRSLIHALPAPGC